VSQGPKQGIFGRLLHDEGRRRQNRFLKCDYSCFLFGKANIDVPSTHNIIYVRTIFALMFIFLYVRC
jgi:hypothetical protein